MFKRKTSDDESSDDEMVPPSIKPDRRISVSAESMEPEEQQQQVEKVVIPKTVDQIKRINASLKNNFLFRQMDEDQYQDIVNAMFEKQVEDGVDIIVQGTPGDYFYVVESGSFDVYVSGDKKVSYGSGGSFGELALLYNAPRAATVKATSPSIVWALDRFSFRHMLMEMTLKKRRLYESFLEEVKLLKSLEEYERHKVADALEFMVFEDGQVVIKEGDVGDRFFIIESGLAVVTKLDESGKDLHLAELKKGDYFGELALINDAPRKATVTAKGKLKCVSLDKGAFTRLLGPCLPILQRNMGNYENIVGKN
jgi:CRP-like cAMP-binding protein